MLWSSDVLWMAPEVIDIVFYMVWKFDCNIVISALFD